MEKFSLQHTVLYAKGWYKRYSSGNTIWEDLAITLEMDGYMGTFIGDSEIQRNNSIAYLIVGQFERLPKYGHSRSLQAFYEGVKPHNCWKYGYATKDFTLMQSQKDIDASPVYDYNEAAVRYCLSNFFGMDNTEWVPCQPDYTKLPKPKDITKKKLKLLKPNK